MPVTRSLFSLENYLPMPEEEQGLLLAAEVAVAAALEEPDWDAVDDALDQFDHLLVGMFEVGLDMTAFVASLRDHTHEWRTALATHPLAGKGDRLVAVSIELCTTSAVIDDEDLRSSEAIRRLDCIFDLLEVGWGADEVNDVFADAGASLLDEPAEDWVPGALGGAKKAAEFLSFFHPVAGLAATAALQFVPEEAAAAGASGPEELARLIGICFVTGALEDGEAEGGGNRAIVSQIALTALAKDAERTSKRVERLLKRDGDVSQPKVQSLLALQRYQAAALAPVFQ